MEDLPGLEVMRQLKEQSPDTECIVVTGFASQESAIEAVNLGAYSYVQKPYDIEQLLMTIRRAVEKRETEEALNATRAQLQHVTATSPAVIYSCRVDPSGTPEEGYPATFVSDNIAQILGYEAQDCLGDGQWWVEILHPEDAARAAQEMSDLFEQGHLMHEYRIRHQNGNYCWMRDEVVLVRDAAGQPVEFVGSWMDITERRRADRLIRALNRAALAMERALTSEEIFAAVAEEFKELGLACVVLLVDEDRKTIHPTYLSYESGLLRAAERLVGIKAQELGIPIDTVEAYRQVVREGSTVFHEGADEILQQVFSGVARKFAAQAVTMLSIPRFIEAPLVLEDKVIGVLSVQSDELTEGDIPAITAFAHQMSAVWHKVDLLQDLQNSLEQLRTTQAQLLQAQKIEAVGHWLVS